MNNEEGTATSTSSSKYSEEEKNSFFEECKKQIGKSKRYLTRDQDGGCYDDTWKLVVPDDLRAMKNGVMMDADI